MPKEISDWIGSLFLDNSDKKTYQIVGACSCDLTGDTMFENRCDGSDDVERTPCREILEDGWCHTVIPRCWETNVQKYRNIFAYCYLTITAIL